MDNKKIFASNLQKYMKRNDKSRTDIAEALGISYYTVTDWVMGKKYPRMDKVERLAKYFGILKSDLIEDKTAEKEKPATVDELPEKVKDFIEYAKTVPEDKVEKALQVLKLIMGDD